MKYFILLFATLIGMSSAQASVWTEYNQWSPEWEQRYAEWVRDNWNINVFASRTLSNGQSNPYYGLHTDCADTVYSMRIIFSYENGLPFVINDPTGTGTISNKMSRFDSLHGNDRIRNFMRFMYDVVSTHSLPLDTYPVAVTRSTVHAGGLMMTVAKNHHSWSIKDILSIGVPDLIFNSVLGSSASSVLQERQSWPYPDWVFEGNQTPQGNAGFRYWKPLPYLKSSTWQVPGYSEEQYHVSLNNWVRWAQGRLATRQETDSQMMTRLEKSVCDGIQDRVNVVRDAVNYVNRTGGACMRDYATYDNYSTPSRDERIFDDLISLRVAYQGIIHANGGNQLSANVKAQLNKIFPLITQSSLAETQRMGAQGVTQSSLCVITYTSGRTIDMAEFKRRMFAGQISNNPMDPMEYRWGEARGPSSRARSCPSWDPWTPDLTKN